MKIKSLAIIFAGIALSLAAFACTPAQQEQTDNDAAPSAVEAKATTEATSEQAATEQSEAEPRSAIVDIRRAWASDPLTSVADGKNAGVEQFALAFCKHYSAFKTNQLIVDYLTSPKTFSQKKTQTEINHQARNGFLSCLMDIDLDWGTVCCYWKRNNGHKLVAFLLEEIQEDWDNYEILLVFYDYDPATDTMTPEPELSKKVERICSLYDEHTITLPTEGKDIIVVCHNLETKHDFAQEVIYQLSWNGTDFNEQKIRDNKILSSERPE